MTENLKQKTIKGIVWSLFDRGGTQAIQFILGIYLARILMPEDYGLVGMLMIFLIISQIFINGGFGHALIQKGDETTSDDFNTVFYTNVFISLFFYIILYFSAPLIASFYGEPRLTLLTRVLGLLLVIRSFGLIQTTILAKRINFKTTAKINLISALLAGGVAILLAKMGFGVWALVASLMIDSILRTALLWIITKWRPGLVYSIKSLKSIFSFGANMIIIGLVQEINNNLYLLVIGKFFTISDVGFYSNAKKIQERTGNTLVFSIQSVMFSSLSLMKDNLNRFKNALRTNIQFTCLFVFPVLTGLMVIAEPFVTLALTNKWLPSVVYIQLLGIMGIFYSVTSLLKVALTTIGKVTINKNLTLASNLLLAILIITGLVLKQGIIVLVAYRVIWSIIQYIMYIFYTKKIIQYSYKDQMADLLYPFIFSIIMSMIVYLIGETFPEISFLSLATQILSGIIIYIILIKLFHNTAFLKIRDIIRGIK